MVFNLYYLLFANPLCLLKSTENSKKKSSITSSNRCFTHFGMNIAISRVYVRHSYMCWISCFEYVLVITLKRSYGSRLLFYDLPKKGVPWKFWLDPRFPRNPKLKWTLKRLPLDRGCFKFYFFKKGKSLPIISCHTHLLPCKLVVLF